MSDRASYFKFLFDKAKNIEGVVKGMDAVSFFQKSGLPTVTLRDIWNLSSFRKQGFLMQDQFELALRYISLAQRGFPANQNSLQFHDDQKALPKFEGFQLPKVKTAAAPPPPPPKPSYDDDPFAELVAPIQTQAKVQLPQNLMQPPAPMFPGLGQLGFPAAQPSAPLQSAPQNLLGQSLTSVPSNNLLDFNIDLTKSLGNNILGGNQFQINHSAPKPPQPTNLLFKPTEPQPPASKTNVAEEEEDFDDFEAAAEEEEEQVKTTQEAPQNLPNLLGQDVTPENSPEAPKDKFENFLSQNLLNFTAQPQEPKINSEPPQEQIKTASELKKEENIVIPQKSKAADPQVLIQKQPVQEKTKDIGGSRLSLLDAAFAELDLDLGKPEEKQEKEEEPKLTQAIKQTPKQEEFQQDFNDFEDAEQQQVIPKEPEQTKEKKNVVLMPIDLDFSVDSPVSFANTLTEKTETEAQESKNYEIPSNLPPEASPTQLRIQLQQLGISLSDSESQQAKNEAKKHVVLSKPMVLSDNSDIGPSSVSQDSDRTDKDQQSGGWNAFNGPQSEKKESNSTQIKSWFASMKKQEGETEPSQSVQSQLNNLFPALEGINTLPELEQKQKIETEVKEEEEQKQEEDFGDFEDAKSDQDKSPKILELEQQITVNRPNQGLKELSFIQKIEFDEGKLLSNFEDEFKEDRPRRSTVKSATVQKDESVADEIARQEIIFSARPSITHRQSENCFDHFQSTQLPKQISKLGLSNQEEMSTLARFLFQKGLFKYQKQIQLESKYQRQIVELNNEKRKAMEADELELAIEYRQKIKSKQQQMHGQQYLEEIEDKIISQTSEAEQEYWIWTDFKDLMEECLRLKRQSKDDYSQKYIESLRIYEKQLKEVIEERNQEGYEALLLEMENKTNILKNVKRVTLEVIAQKCSLVCEGLNEECSRLKERIAGLVQILAEIESQSLQEETLNQFLHSAQFSTFYQGVHSLRRIRANLFSSLSQINAYIESSVSIEIEGTLQQLGNLERDFQEINMLLDQLVQDSEISIRGENGHSSSDKFNFIESLSKPLARSDSDAEYEFKSFLKTLIEI